MPAPAELEAVHARTTTGSTVETSRHPVPAESSPSEQEPPAAGWPIPSQAEIAIAGLVGLVVAGATGEPLYGATLAVVVLGWELIRRSMSRVSWSFGDGFLGYRADLGQARGIQEDDDVHWSWR